MKVALDTHHSRHRGTEIWQMGTGVRRSPRLSRVRVLAKLLRCFAHWRRGTDGMPVLRRALRDPSLYHHGISSCGPDWRGIGYLMAHALVGSVPVARTSKGYLSTRAAMVHRDTSV